MERVGQNNHFCGMLFFGYREENRQLHGTSRAQTVLYLPSSTFLGPGTGEVGVPNEAVTSAKAGTATLQTRIVSGAR